MSPTQVFQRYAYDGIARNLATWWTLRREAITLPWEVPEETVVVEFDGEFWRVVPHRGLVRTFSTRDEALEWAQMAASIYLSPWRIVEKPTSESRRRSA